MPTGKAAFTLVEMMVSVGIFAIILIIGLVGLQMVGLRVSQLTTTKLMISADSREALNQIREDIRGASALVVGKYANGVFTGIGNGTNQIGGALKIYPTMNSSNTAVATNIFTIYYRTNTDLSCLTTNKQVTVLARNIINDNYFQSENFDLTTNKTAQNKCVIHVNLRFASPEYAFSANRTNSYLLETRISPRAPDLE